MPTQMTIVQISDLHFGAHNRELAKALKRRVSKIKPDLIVVTGDLADTPDKNLFIKARNYLGELEKQCRPGPKDNPARPRIICVPGNHDVLPYGWLPKLRRELQLPGHKYKTFFSGFSTSFFFRPEKVWVFGFDSVQTGKVGGGGEISSSELERFHSEYSNLMEQHPSEFAAAFKIVLVHHHPLPVNWNASRRQRWLTLTNSGTFLAGVLHKRVDLILHGHEHLPAYARLRSSLGGDLSTEVAVLSLGATLAKKVRDTNWFNVVTIRAEGTVEVTSYSAFGQDFEDKGKEIAIRSQSQAQEAAFATSKETMEFWYREVTSTTVLDKDGDARRSVEYNGLKILNIESPRARAHEIEMSYTSGYIDMPEVTALEGCNLAGIHFIEPSLDKTRAHKSLKRTISWGGRTLAADEDISYQCTWFAVNGFAMSQRQFEHKYAEISNLEFTHFTVQDPVKELLIVVKFPADFQLPERPEIRVSRYEESVDARRWARSDALEHGLRRAAALSYLKVIRVATLRVHAPLVGYSYGIQWRVPESMGRHEGIEAGRIGYLTEILLRTDGSEIVHQQALFPLLGRVLMIARQAFKLDTWSQALEISFMIFSPTERKLKIVGALVAKIEAGEICLQHPEQPFLVSATFDYGDGIAGRAFKANESRFYAKPVDKRKEPDYYREIEGQRPHDVVLSMPVRNPTDPGYAYGVLNFSAVDSGCPLRSFAMRPVANVPGSSAADTLAHLQTRIDGLFYNDLSALTN